MISWRYHVVSIVAVVLAFGLGILAGTTVIGEGFAITLQKNYDEAIGQRDDALAQVALYERFVESLQPTLRTDALVGEEAVVVTSEGVERPARQAADALTASGVDVLATLQLTRRLAEPEIEDNAAALQGILGLPASDPVALSTGVAEALAERLAVGSLAAQDDVLGALLAGGFVTADRDLEAEALLGIGGAGQLVVIAAGGPRPARSPAPEALLVPFTERLVRLDAPTVAVGPTEDGYGFVAAVRNANEIPDCSMVTVDDIDLAGIGGITLAMAIDRLRDDADPTVRPGGDYGIRGDSLVPGAADPPDSCRR
jgi:Copper transport outer membrane protein, MctB